MKFYHIAMAVFAATTLLMACNNNNNGLKIVEREEEPDIYQVENEDKAMNNAISTARQTLQQFNDALKSGADSLESFSLKVRYNVPDGQGEHIWLNEIKVNNSVYTGIVNNVPDVITQVKFGDTVTINNDNISDWMYLANNKLRGGYTLRVLMDKMSPEEKKKLQAQSGFIIE
jgi:uncharacterized protein YegJ (DUF2314 family)